MSSFIGHGLAALTIHAALHPLQVRRAEASEEPERPTASTPQRRSQSSPWRLAWMVWLIAIAWAPDLDHWIPWLNSAAHAGIRVTHSIAGSQLLPGATVALLHWRGMRGRVLGNLALQASLTGLSQVLLDIAVGIAGMPLFWPLSDFKLKSPVGILPSAGAIDLRDYYFYWNLGLELGVLIPLAVLVWLGRWGGQCLPRWSWRTLAGLATATSLYFMQWASQLSR